ncbi:hypothetical protein D4S03_09730 [bacterium]|nr:MAG: hypothetical protein D4S03_09730 [bacterium]
MKNYLVSIFVLVLVSTLVLAACGPTPTPTREQQLSETGLFGRHAIEGVTIENGFEGKVSGGFFLFAGGVNGQISSTTKYIISWYPTPEKYTTTEVLRSLIVVNIVADQDEPEIEFVFRNTWMTTPPSYFESVDTYNGDQANYYTDGAKLNLNNFAVTENLDVVNIYISPEDLWVPPNQ